MVGAAGIEPATACSQSRRAASALRSELAASPMPTAPATMATFLLGFRINHRGPSPGNDRWLFPKWKTPRLVVAAGQGGKEKAPRFRGACKTFARWRVRGSCGRGRGRRRIPRRRQALRESKSSFLYPPSFFVRYRLAAKQATPRNIPIGWP